jgi:hypothetical protein
MTDENDASRRRSAFTQAEINRAVQAAKKVGAYAVEIKADSITIILQPGQESREPKARMRVTMMDPGRAKKPRALI